MMKEGHTASEIGHILVEGGCGAASMKGDSVDSRKRKKLLIASVNSQILCKGIKG